jgi:hypothetical protein
MRSRGRVLSTDETALFLRQRGESGASARAQYAAETVSLYTAVQGMWYLACGVQHFLNLASGESETVRIPDLLVARHR